MNATTTPDDSTDRQSIGLLTGLVGVGIVGLEIAGTYVFLERAFDATLLAYAGAALAALVVGGSFLLVLTRQVSGDEAPVAEQSTLTRAAELIVSIAILTVVTAVAFLCGLVLTLVARLGGPDPRTDDGDRLRVRLLDWARRNKTFMRNNGRGTLPIAP